MSEPGVGEGAPASVAPAAQTEKVTPKPEVVDPKIEKIEADVNEAKVEADKRDAEMMEKSAEKPRVASHVRENEDFKRFWGDLYNAAKTNSKDGNVSLEQIDQQASNMYYQDLVEKAYATGIPQEVSEDPLFQKEYGKAVMDAQKEGKPLDKAELEKTALANFQRVKDLQKDDETVRLIREIANEEDQKKKDSLIMLLLKTLGVGALSALEQTAGMVMPRT